MRRVRATYPLRLEGLPETVAEVSAAATPQTNAPSTPSNTPSGPLTASDRGVTADTIKLGVIMPDLGGLSALGVEFGADDQEGKAQSAIDTINAAGGIFGRKIKPVFRYIDVIDQNKMRQGCLELANDAEVFAAINIGGFYGSAIRCLTAETKTPFIAMPGGQCLGLQGFQRLFHHPRRQRDQPPGQHRL